ncbi:MBL fold metallo-hydrolase [Candidatus Poriferisocius sp.]|uniref:MBL fold metallo-hydrolase n=1 Tax=Candidatus Poriferisocius sp. TaxID=3101276 RepID=UPI003B0296A2
MGANPALPVIPEWFRTKRIDSTTSLLFEPHVDPLLRCNMWLVRGQTSDLLIDTGMGIVPLEPVLERSRNKRLIVVATHSHLDHVGGLHEFEERWVHIDEANDLLDPSHVSLVGADMPASKRAMFKRAGYSLGDYLLSALPARGFDMSFFRTVPTRATVCLHEGDTVDLGDRAFEVLHLPGHSPGSIGLWDRKNSVLFSGDAIYDGPLLDELPESNIDDYCQTMTRLRALPAEAVHGGHEESFGRSRLIAIADAYLDRRSG